MRPARGAYAVLLLIYVVGAAFLGRFVQTDEVFYKAAGRHWAATGRFAAPEVVGYTRGGPALDEVYLAYPPLYTALFGLYTRVLGFGPRRCILFDALLHALLSVATLALAGRFTALPESWTLGAAVSVLPLGTLARPDELAMSLGAAAACAWMPELARTLAAAGGTVTWAEGDGGRLSGGRRRAIAAGVLLGLCAATSAGVALATALVMAVLIVVNRAHFGVRLREVGTLALAAVIALAAVVAPILVPHPDAVVQFVGLARAQVSPLALLFSAGPGTALAECARGFRFAWRYGKWQLLPLVSCLAIGGLAWLVRRRPTTAVRGLWWGAALVLVAALAAVPGKYTYAWFGGPWLFVVAAATAHEVLARERAAVRLLFALVAMGALAAGSVPTALQILIQATLPPEQRLEINYARVRAIVPPGSRVMSADAWWFLADRCQVYDPLFSNPPLDTIDFVIQGGNGSGRPGQPGSFREHLQTWLARDFELAHDGLNRVPLTLFGRPLTSSAYGYGTYILRRRGSSASSLGGEDDHPTAGRYRAHTTAVRLLQGQ